MSANTTLSYVISVKGHVAHGNPQRYKETVELGERRLPYQHQVPGHPVATSKAQSC